MLKSGHKYGMPPEALTIGKVRAAIPAHLMEQDTARSMMYLARDIVQITVTAAAMWYILLPAAAALPHPVSAVAKVALWAAYTFVQGTNMTSVWVIAHECGHRAFSPSRLVNDVVGMVLHSALLVPYHPWRISHGNHHKHTNHLDLDTVFVPRKEATPLAEAVEQSPFYSLLTFVGMLLGGWPGYLFFNVASQNYQRRANHFEPSSPLFRPSDKLDVIVSDFALIGVVAMLGTAIASFGFANVALWYLCPYLVVNAWLVYITFMQHTDVRIPHYDAAHWNFMRGALATVDRDYGAVLSEWLHHIHDAHVVHHIFSTVPHYNAIEITRKYIKEALGPYYASDARPLLTSTVESWTRCKYVVPADGIAYFRH
jgi:omega-6 fatty acid desaturase (delta-12 desaturase)